MRIYEAEKRRRDMKREQAASAVVGLAAELDISLDSAELKALSGIVAQLNPHDDLEEESLRWDIVRAEDPAYGASERNILLNGLLRTLEQRSLDEKQASLV